MNEKTEAASPDGLEEVLAGFQSPVANEPPERPTLRPEELRGADLRGQDLTQVEGLLPEHLAGADLTGAKLPQDIAKFPALGQVAAISSEARKIFIGLLAACVYSWLVIGTTTDVALILNTASSPLPIINTPIPIAGFYVVGAAILAAVYCYLHCYLQRLWRTLATLPAKFPDGVALEDKTDPWLLTNLVRAYMPLLAGSPPPLSLARLENVLVVVLAWWLVPITLVFYWARFLPAHDIVGLTWLSALIAVSTFFGRHAFHLARAMLSMEVPPAPKAAAATTEQPAEGKQPEQQGQQSGPPGRLSFRVLREFRHVRPDHVIVWLFLPFFIFTAFSLSATRQSPRDSKTNQIAAVSPTAPWQSLRKVDGSLAKFLNFVGIRTYADLREVEVARRPEGWTGNEWAEVKRVDLRDRNIVFAEASRAFLANADLRGANLKGSDLSFAELQGADLRGAHLAGADLEGIQLQGANLQDAHLEGAYLTDAQLQGADLTGIDLVGADLQRTQLQGANLSGAKLQGAKLLQAQLQGADLQGAQLQGASLFGADLGGADLQEASLWRAVTKTAARGLDRFVGDVYLWDFADLRGSDVHKMTDDEIKAVITEASAAIGSGRRQSEITQRLAKAFENRPARPHFPDSWKTTPSVMFEDDDPSPKPFDWGDRKWDTEAYDEYLAEFLGNLACDDVPAAQTGGLARRALAAAERPELFRGGPDRLWPQLFAERLLGPHCPPAKGLPEDVRRQLGQLAARFARESAGTGAPESPSSAATE